MKIGVRGFAERAGVSQWTIRAWIRERRVPYYKIGSRIVFDEKEIEDLLTRARVEPTPGREIGK